MNLVEQKSVYNLLILQTVLSHYYKTIKIELSTIDKNKVLSSPLRLPFSVLSILRSILECRLLASGLLVRSDLVRMIRLCYAPVKIQAEA